MAASGLGSQSQLLSWADRTFGHGLTSITKGKPLHPLNSTLHTLRDHLLHDMYSSLIMLPAGDAACMGSLAIPVFGLEPAFVTRDKPLQ